MGSSAAGESRWKRKRGRKKGRKMGPGHREEISQTFETPL
jgi:hypothetical protein